MIGAATFILSLPFFTPLVLSLGSPEFLMLVLWGLSAVSVLGGKSPLTATFVVFGVGVTLFGALFLVPWPYIVIVCLCFVASGLPMWVGDLARYLSLYNPRR